MHFIRVNGITSSVPKILGVSLSCQRRRRTSNQPDQPTSVKTKGLHSSVKHLTKSPLHQIQGDGMMALTWIDPTSWQPIIPNRTCNVGIDNPRTGKKAQNPKDRILARRDANTTETPTPNPTTTTTAPCLHQLQRSTRVCRSSATQYVKSNSATTNYTSLLQILLLHASSDWHSLLILLLLLLLSRRTGKMTTKERQPKDPKLGLNKLGIQKKSLMGGLQEGNQ